MGRLCRRKGKTIRERSTLTEAPPQAGFSIVSRAQYLDHIIVQVFPGRLRSVCTGCFRYHHSAGKPSTRHPRCNTQFTLHYAVRPPLHRPPAPPLHCGPAPRSETACLGSLGSRLRSVRRVWHIVLPLLLQVLHYGRSPRPRLWATSLHSASSGAPSPQRASRAYRLRIRNLIWRSGRLRGFTAVPAQALTE